MHAARGVELVAADSHPAYFEARKYIGKHHFIEFTNKTVTSSIFSYYLAYEIIS